MSEMDIREWPRLLQAASPPSDEELRACLQPYLKGRKAAIMASRRRTGVSASAIIGAVTLLMDEVLRDLSRSVVRQMQAAGRPWDGEACCLVALGGYGRGDLFPFSDIDVMVLYREEAKRDALRFARKVFQVLWDVGLQLGNSVRTIQDCLEIGGSDLHTRTALMDARQVYGGDSLFQQFEEQFWTKVGRRRVNRFIMDKLRERASEHQRFGSTVYLLEPDVKKSKGGLRDLNLLNWAAAARYGVIGLENLLERGLITRGEQRKMQEARDFLWKVRVELHAYAGRCQDVLSFDEQVRIARLLGYEDESALLGVEKFMRDYYRHSSRALEISTGFVHHCLSRGVWGTLLRTATTRRLNGLFLVNRSEVALDEGKVEAFFEDAGHLFQLYRFSQAYNVPIDRRTQAVLRERVDRLSEDYWKHPDIYRFFEEVLSRPGRVSELLKQMNENGLLERVIPEYEWVHHLMQFNQYHKYTIDEHCIRAVGYAEALAGDKGLPASVYREVKNKALLHLSLLLHDAGKGRGGDHCLIGEQIALATADRLGFSPQERSLLAFLVREHLIMAHTAFRRDLYDENVLLRFAAKVAQPEALKMLYVLTYADICAVGPDTWTPWKQDLLAQLYTRTLEILSGTGEALSQEERIERVRRDVRKLLKGAYAGEWLEEQLRAVTPRYLLATPVEKIVKHLKRMPDLAGRKVIVEGVYQAGYGVSEYTIYTFDELTPGIFYKIAGVMAAKGLQILDAQIHTRQDGVVVDTFQVLDPDYTGVPPQRRFDAIAGVIEQVLLGQIEVEAFFASSVRYSLEREAPPRQEPTRVEIDNELSDRYTILDVFAHDRQGLLYVITKSVFELGLSVHFAKVSTRLDQVVDVFYVTDRSGQKVADSRTLETIRETLVSKIESFLTPVA